MRPAKLSEILSFIDGLEGSCYAQEALSHSLDFALMGFAPVESACENDVTFWTGDASVETGLSGNAGGVTRDKLSAIRAGLLFVPQSFSSFVENGICSELPNVKFVCAVRNPYHAMVQFLNKFAVETDSPNGVVADTARIHPSAVVEGGVGENSYVGPGCVVMKGATVGKNCSLEANVVVYPNVRVGDGCVFQAGAVIGSRGFGFYEYEGCRLMVPHLAGVVIGGGCSFGANTVVAAGFLAPTTIGNNCHFDSFVQIAHNCKLGNNIFMASQSGVAGSAIIEDDVEFAGGAQSAGHLTIGKGAKVAAKAGVTKNVPAGAVVAGFPAEDIASWRRSVVRLRQMGKK